MGYGAPRRVTLMELLEAFEQAILDGQAGEQLRNQLLEAQPWAGGG